MSLQIDPATVSEVLLADGWHTVEARSFNLDAYEFVRPGHDYEVVIHNGGQSGICATGFGFVEKMEDGLRDVFGPLTSILAVRSHPDA